MWDDDVTKKYSLWWKDSLHGESDNPHELVGKILDILEEWGEELDYWRGLRYWGINIGGLKGARLFTEEELAEAIRQEKLTRARRAEGKQYEAFFVEGFMGIPKTMNRSEFTEHLEEVRANLAQMREEHPVRERLVDGYHAVRRFFVNQANPRDIKRAIKHRWQRLQRGWSDQDAWSADAHILDVMIGMLEKLREWRTGLPNKHLDDYTHENWRDYILRTQPATFTEEEWWDGLVLNILTSFKRYRSYRRDYFRMDTLSKEEIDWIDSEFEKAGRDFFRYFADWWD